MTDNIKALPMDTAPKDNTLVRLLVDYSGEGEHPLEDAVQAWTIGFNNFEDSEIDEWQFAGWSWSQDCFCEGQGRVIGWAPFHPEGRLYDGAASMADGGDTPMTAAEEVLAWLLVEKIGIPDDVSYTPDQAQKIIADRLAQNQPPQTNVLGWHVMSDSGWSDITDSQDVADQWIADGFIVTPLVAALAAEGQAE